MLLSKFGKLEKKFPAKFNYYLSQAFFYSHLLFQSRFVILSFEYQIPTGLEFERIIRRLAFDGQVI